MSQIEHVGHTYRVEPMGVMTEFHLTRRMGSAMVEVLAAGLRRGDETMLLPEVIAWGGLSNADAEFVVNACMGALRRHDERHDSWAPVWVSGRPMFDDIDSKVVMYLVREVLRIRIGPFLPDGDQRASGDAAGGTGQVSPTAKT